MTAPLDWRKIEDKLKEYFESRIENATVYCSDGDWIADFSEEDAIVNLTALARHLSDELTSP